MGFTVSDIVPEKLFAHEIPFKDVTSFADYSDWVQRMQHSSVVCAGPSVVVDKHLE